jgi:hypothetical protein
VSEYLYAVEHMLNSVRHLAEGGRALHKWERLIFRDVLASAMCAPGQKKHSMRPSRSFWARLVRDPEDHTRAVCIELSHPELWWSSAPEEWRDRAKDYLRPKRVADRTFYGDACRAAEAAENAAADAADARASRTKTLANIRRFERERALVRPSPAHGGTFPRRCRRRRRPMASPSAPSAAQFNRQELSEVPAGELLLWIVLNVKITKRHGKYMYYVTKKGAVAHGRRRNHGACGRAHTLCFARLAPAAGLLQAAGARRSPGGFTCGTPSAEYVAPVRPPRAAFVPAEGCGAGFRRGCCAHAPHVCSFRVHGEAARLRGGNDRG